MEWEYKRLQSLSTNWPKDHVSPKALAEAGFFFLHEDTVKCAFCDIIISNWDSKDIPLRRHVRENPGCPFLKEEKVGNIPCQLQEPIAYSLVPKRPHMQNERRRYDSFSKWPFQRSNVFSLIQSGFYYSGCADVVICFFCEITIGNWEPEDDPFYEHMKHSPACGYIYLNQKRFSDVGKDVVGNGPEQRKTRDIIETASSLFKNEVKNQSSDQEMLKYHPSDHNSFLCIICLDQEKNVVFRPCNHFVACFKCSNLISKCAVCRADITHKLKVYLS